MKDKIKKLQKLCEVYRLDLQIRYYGDRQVCFSGIDENDDEIFMASIRYDNHERRFCINLNLSKEEILLLLSLDDLTDDELGIKPQVKVDLKTKYALPYSGTYHDCPKCDKVIGKHYNYCPYCGQRLDWSE